MPSGGKFVNGTGSIATNGNKMDIAGNNKNNVIAWGGGFNIGKEASVNFTTNQKNYLNLDYTNKASQILGKLNGGTNNIYLVNPSGVLIGKDASINANKFGVSTSPFDNNAIQTFSNSGSFSPVFSANKGDIVNMGTISANEIVLVGNRVTNVGNYVDEKGKKQVAFGSFNKKDSLTNTKLEITANHTDLHANGNTIGTIDSINVTAEGNNAKIEVGQSATGWTDVQLRINQNGNNVPTTTYASIKDTEDWSSFTDIINGGNANKIDTFKLLKDIDFKDAGAIEPVGNDNSKPFSGNFYGNGHTLSNLLINADGKNSAGLFGYINGGSVQDLTIDGLNFQGSALVIGGFAARINNGTFSNIVLNNIGDIVGDAAGGFAGQINNGTFSNIALNNIGEINSELNSAGGFASLINNGGTFSNIVFNNIGNISGDHAGGSAGGFAGDGSPTSATDIYFYGAMNLSGNNTNQNNINSHNPTALNLTNTTDLQTIQNHMQNGSTLKNLEYVIGTNGNSYLHMVTNGKIGGADSEITFDNEEYKLPKVSNNTTSPTPPPSISNGDNLSSVTLEASDFDVSILESIINEILNKEYVLNLDDWTNFGAFSKDYATILSYLLENTQDETLKESIKQSLEFYAEFNKGETDGLKAEFEKWYGNDSSSTYNSSMKKYEGIAASIETLKNYVNGTLKPKLERIQSNLNRFEFLKAEIARLDKVYQEALENKLLPYDQLEIIYKDTKEKIDAYYTEAKGLLATLKEDNKPFLEALIGKTYNFKDKYNDVTGSFSFVGSNIGGNIESSINGGLGDKPILTLPDNDDSGNNQTIDGGNSAEIANTLAKQTKLASKEAVITLPAQEKEDVITEDERELGRACIVSDNAKTNNPCVAAF